MNNKFILPILLIIISIGLFVMYIDPTYEQTKVLKNKNLEFNEALNKSKELRQFRDSLLEQYNSFSQEDLVKLKKLLPDTVDNVRLIMDIDSIASEYGITIQSIKVDAPQTESKGEIAVVSNSKPYDFVTLSFSMNASYEDFISFVTDIKDSLRLVDIKDIEFDVSETGSGLNKYNITIRTYWLK